MKVPGGRTEQTRRLLGPKLKAEAQQIAQHVVDRQIRPDGYLEACPGRDQVEEIEPVERVDLLEYIH